MDKATTPSIGAYSDGDAGGNRIAEVKRVLHQCRSSESTHLRSLSGKQALSTSTPSRQEKPEHKHRKYASATTKKSGASGKPSNASDHRRVDSGRNISWHSPLACYFSGGAYTSRVLQVGLDLRTFEQVRDEYQYLSANLSHQGDRVRSLLGSLAVIHGQLLEVKTVDEARKLRKDAGFVQSRITDSEHQERMILHRLVDVWSEMQSRERLCQLQHQQLIIQSKFQGYMQAQPSFDSTQSLPRTPVSPVDEMTTPTRQTVATAVAGVVAGDAGENETGEVVQDPDGEGPANAAEGSDIPSQVQVTSELAVCHGCHVPDSTGTSTLLSAKAPSMGTPAAPTFFSRSPVVDVTSFRSIPEFPEPSCGPPDQTQLHTAAVDATPIIVHDVRAESTEDKRPARLPYVHADQDLAGKHGPGRRNSFSVMRDVASKERRVSLPSLQFVWPEEPV